MSGPGALGFAGVSAGYGGRVVVSGATFAVSAGEFVGLVGPNGAGKSTLLRAVTGGADVLAGEILLEDASVRRMAARERARLVGVVPQSVVPPFAFTARAFVEMGRHPHLTRLGALGEDDRRVVEEAMERTDTARLADERADELSGGDLQRLTLAQALAQQPRVLLLDEPTSHLDLNHALQVLDLVRGLADEGLAVLAVFHDLEIAARYADRVAIVSDATVRSPAPPAEALDARVVSEVFGVRAVVGTDPVTGSVSVTPLVRGQDLAAAPRAGRIGVVCGSGAGAALMRQLVLDGYEVVAGALNYGDVDQAVADALGIEHEPLPAFASVDEAVESRVRAAYAGCERIIVCRTPFGRPNLPNLRAAVECGVPLVAVGEMDGERDFTGGEAGALWDGAIASGAVRVATEAEALAELQRLTGGDGR